MGESEKGGGEENTVLDREKPRLYKTQKLRQIPTDRQNDQRKGRRKRIKLAS